MPLTEKSYREILVVADPIMDNLMEGSTAIDHEKHTRDFTTNEEFVAVFRRPQSVAIVWKQWFTKQAGEYVAELVLVEKESTYLVDHAMVF